MNICDLLRFYSKKNKKNKKRQKNRLSKKGFNFFATLRLIIVKKHGLSGVFEKNNQNHVNKNFVQF